MQKAETKLANTDIYFEKVYGIAQGCRQQNETVYDEQYSLLYKGSILTSETKAATDFFIKMESGKELSLSFPVSIPIRDGHLITGLYACAGDAGKSMSPIGFYNHTTEKLHLASLGFVCRSVGIAYPASQFFAKVGCSTVVGLILLMIFLAVMGWGTGYFWMLSLLCVGILLFVGYGSKKLDAAKNATKYLTEYAQLQKEVSTLFA